MKIDTVSVIGLGYIGLPTAAVIASRAVRVIGVDVNESAVETINAGGIHIVEPDLDIAVRAAVNAGMLRATTRPEPADVFVIAVPTPLLEDRTPDLSRIKAAAVSIAPVLKAGDLVLLESTSPVGTTEQLVTWLAEARPDLRLPTTDGDVADLQVAYCPERVLPGHVLHELITNDRIIGGVSQHCARQAARFYQLFVSGKLHATNSRTAEMVKLTENSFRDVNIALANELSLICDELHIDVWELIELANHHPRVNLLKPGPGVGGHCIAVDPWFIVHSAPAQARLIKMAREVNDAKPDWVIGKVRAAAAGIENARIACLGLAFKADIDDLRESPAVGIVKALAAEELGTLLVVEPNIAALPPELARIESLRFTDLDTALDKPDIVLILVDHSEFRQRPIADFAGAEVIDTRGMCSPPAVR
jgi:UDP-N-acetyl-D-mannosaminuronic acid dehydrogenase